MLKILRRIKQFGIDLLNIGNPRVLSLLSLEAIIIYVKPVKRLLLTLRYPRFSNIEKRIPLQLDSVQIQLCHMKLMEIEFDRNRIIFKNEKVRYSGGILSFYRIYKSRRSFKSFSRDIKEVVLKVVSVLLDGRVNLRISHFNSDIEIPMDLNLDVSNVYVSHQSLINHSGNVFRKVKCATIFALNPTDNIRLGWIQNAEQLSFMQLGENHILTELPNLCAKLIKIQLTSSAMVFLQLVRVFIENRQTEEGSLFLITWLNRRYDDPPLIELLEMGFVKIAEDRFLLSLDNDMKVRIISKSNFSYVRIEIVMLFTYS